MRIELMALAGTAILSLAGCSDETAPTAAPQAATAETLSAGEYEVATKVEDLRSTDHTTPLTRAKLAAAGDAPIVHRACIAADGTIDPQMFTEAGDDCKVDNSYARHGRINIQLGCTRSAPGSVMHSVDGNFTADGFTATVNTGTYFTGSGDYAMRRAMTGKRVGNCPPAGEKKA